MDKTILKFKVEAKKREVKQKMKEVGTFIVNNREWVMLTVAGGIGGAIKLYSRKQNVNKMEKLKDRMIYDRSGGFYYETKRKLTNGELAEIDRRRINGERLGNILTEMNVLK